MYLRTIRRRNKDGSVVGYVQLAHNVWNPAKQQSRAQVIHSFGREDRLDREALGRLVRSITRFLEPEEALAAQAPEELRFLESRPMGGAWVLDQLWRRLGVAAALSRVAQRRRVTPLVERLIFCLVANRALAPMSKLAALEWAQHDVWLPGVGELGADPQVFYRAMDFLLDCDGEVQREVFFAVADLLNLEVDLILFDTTSTYFEIEAEREDGFRVFGNSKDHRPDLPQVVVGMAVTKEGIPVRCFIFAGNASDQVIIREVKDALRDWRLHRVIWVCDTGFASAENRAYLQRAGGHYILGEKLRQGTENRAALARQGRYRVVEQGLEVKQVWVGDGELRRRFAVCRNLDEARRDKLRRARALERLAAELEAVERRSGEARTQAEAELLTHPTLKRYLTRRRGRLVIDAAKARDEQQLDGKFLISSSDDSLSPAEMALQAAQRSRARLARPEAHPRPAAGLPPQGRPHPRARAAVLPRAAAHPRRRDPGQRHLAQPAPRARARPPRLLPRLRRPRAPAHRDHAAPARDPQDARRPRTTQVPRDRAREARLVTTPPSAPAAFSPSPCGFRDRARLATVEVRIKKRARRMATVFLWTLEYHFVVEAIPDSLTAEIRERQLELLAKWEDLNG